MSDPVERTCYVTNLDDRVTQELLEELFVQTGPLEKLILRNSNNSTHRFALAIFDHEATVPFACDLMDRVLLFGRRISVRPKSGSLQEKSYRAKHSNFAAPQFANCPQYPATFQMHDAKLASHDRVSRIQHGNVVYRGYQTGQPGVGVAANPAISRKDEKHLNRNMVIDEYDHRRHHSRRDERVPPNHHYYNDREQPNYQNYNARRQFTHPMNHVGDDRRATADNASSQARFRQPSVPYSDASFANLPDTYHGRRAANNSSNNRGYPHRR